MQNFNAYEEDVQLDLRKEVGKYLRYWPWFIISLFLFLSAAYLYLRYTPASYQTQATILIKDGKNSGFTQAAMFQDLGLMGFGSTNLENEIEILKSRRLAELVVEQLNLRVSYFNEGRIKTSELFEELPFKLEILNEETEWEENRYEFNVVPVSAQQYYIISDKDTKSENYTFGQAVDYKGLEFKLTPMDVLKLEQSTQVLVRNTNAAVTGVRTGVDVQPSSKQSSVLRINSVSTIAAKSRAIIDELVEQFNRDAIQDKNMVSKNTADFIDERLAIIWQELDSVEMGKVAFKESHKMVDLIAEGQLSLQTASEYNKRLIEVETERSQLNAMINYLNSGDQSNLLPANLASAGTGLIAHIQQYNEIVLRRNQMLINATETHPNVVSLTEQMNEMKANINESLQNLKTSVDIQLADLRRQESKIGAQLTSIPNIEKDFTNIERQQEIKQSLYLYLLQKREETSISMAVTEPKAKIVDLAYTNIAPVAPKKQIIMLAAFMLGLLVPFGSVYAINLLDNKVHSKEDILEIMPNAVILGEVPKLTKDPNVLVTKNELTAVAESFRVIRTNLLYGQKPGSKTKSAKTILVTSTIKGEGKTLVSVNTALTLAHAGYKVLLVGADIRNPQLHRFFSENQSRNREGLVEYMVYTDTKIQDYIIQSEVSENMHVIHSGAIPPNPAELLLGTRLEECLEEARPLYDFVIIDSAPTLLVTDTLLLSNKVDRTIFVVRAGHTEKDLLEFSRDLIKDEKLVNANFVLNAVSLANFGYGGKYGYGYGYTADLEKEGLWTKFKRGLSGR